MAMMIVSVMIVSTSPRTLEDLVEIDMLIEPVPEVLILLKTLG